MNGDPFRPTYNTEGKPLCPCGIPYADVCKDIGMVGSTGVCSTAEDTGQISSVEYYACLEQVAREIAEARSRASRTSPLPFRSPVLLIQENYVDTVQSMIEKYRILVRQAAVEIDEYALTHHTGYH